MLSLFKRNPVFTDEKEELTEEQLAFVSLVLTNLLDAKPEIKEQKSPRFWAKTVVELVILKPSVRAQVITEAHLQELFEICFSMVERSDGIMSDALIAGEEKTQHQTDVRMFLTALVRLMAMGFDLSSSASLEKVKNFLLAVVANSSFPLHVAEAIGVLDLLELDGEVTVEIHAAAVKRIYNNRSIKVIKRE